MINKTKNFFSQKMGMSGKHLKKTESKHKITKSDIIREK